MLALQGRDVTLLPDLSASEQWKAKSSLLLGICKKVSVSDILERIATKEQRRLLSFFAIQTADTPANDSAQPSVTITH